MLSVIIKSIMLSVFKLNVMMLNVMMLSVTMLNVVAPRHGQKPTREELRTGLTLKGGS
jgi:hypothetical protein